MKTLNSIAFFTDLVRNTDITLWVKDYTMEKLLAAAVSNGYV